MRARDVRGNLLTSALAWEDLTWIRTLLARPDRDEGGDHRDDARRAMDEGAAGVIVSNHGGRQLDTCYPTVRALPEVVRAVSGRADVLVDGGIRRGADIAKAVAMGAKAVLVGRAYAYGLAGPAGGGWRAQSPSCAPISSDAGAARLPLAPAARRFLRGGAEELVIRDPSPGRRSLKRNDGIRPHLLCRACTTPGSSPA